MVLAVTPTKFEAPPLILGSDKGNNKSSSVSSPPKLTMRRGNVCEGKLHGEEEEVLFMVVVMRGLKQDFDFLAF